MRTEDQIRDEASRILGLNVLIKGVTAGVGQITT